MPQRSQPFNSYTGHSGVRGHGVAPTVLVLALGFHGTAAWADCQTVGSAVTCDASSPNPYTGTVGSGASSGNLTITVGPGARIESGNAHAISVGTGNTISLDGNAQVSNSVTTGGPGNYNAGLNTIEFEHTNTLMIGADVRVAAEGTDPAAHAIAFTGRTNVVTNYGTVSSASGAAIWNQLEDNFVSNTIYNYGVIETTATGGDAVVIGSATGNGATDRGMTLYNYAGGRITGNVVLGEGDDTVRLEAGSTLTGSLDGGAAGTDVLYLEGTSGSGELTQDISNFDEINKIESGATWTLSGSLGANSSGKATVVNAYNGELIVTGDNSAAAAGSAMTVWGGARLQVNTTSAMAAIQSNGSGVAAFSQQTDGTYAGVLSGGGNFAKEGAGSLTLTGVNTYTGALQLKEGKVIVSAAENLGAANSRLEFDGGTLNTTSDMTSARRTTIDAGGGTFEVASGTTLNWTGRMLGNGTLVKEGAGTLALSGFNAHGGTVVNAGTVQISNDYGLGNGALTLNNSRLASTADIYAEAAATVNGNGTFDTANGTTLQWMGDIGGAGALVKTGAGTLLLGGDSLYAGGTVVNAGTVQVFKDASLGGGALTLNNASLASLGSFSTARAATLTGNGTFDTTVGTTLGWTGDIGGAGALVKTGQGTLVLGGDNQYAGGTTVNAGTVQVARDANLGGVAGTVALNGGTLAASASFSSARGVTIGAGNGAMSVASGASLDWQGLIDGTGALAKEGAGTLVLGNDNQYAGGTVVNAGTVQVARDANLGAAAGAVALNGGTLAASAGFSSARGVTIGAGNGAMSVASGASLDWQGLIGGTGALIKEGAGTLVLGNDNQYAAGTVVNAGTVQVSRDANLGAAAGTVALNDARLASTGTFSTARAATLTGNGTFDTADGTTLGWAGDIGGAGALVKTGQGTLVLDGDNQYGGGTTVNAGTVQVSRDANLGAGAGAVALNDARLASTGTFSTARAATLTGNGTFDTADGTALGWTGDIGGAGALVKEGLGTLVLDGDNQYGGGTTVNAGTVQVARDANLGAAGGAVRLQGATLASTGSFASARALTLGAAGGTFATLGATTLGWDAAIDGAGGLTKTGAGDLVLSQANTYAGPTLIKEGRLAVNGSIASPVTIDPGGVLGGTGRVLGAVANSGTVAPGNSIGTLTIVGNYAGTGGQLEMEAQLGGDASPADRLVIDGGAATGRTDVVVINQGGLGGQTDQGIPLVVARNGATTTADAFSLASPVAAGAYEYKLLRGTPDGAAANAQNWYLRSGLLVPPAEVPGGGPGGAPEPEFIPFYRPEVALYAGAPMLMRAVGLQALGTYHERTGEQGLMTRDDPDPVRRGAWTRAFGRTFERSGSGDVDPRFDGHVAGLQAGVDLYARRSDQGHADLAGVFGGYANARGHMDGFARGETGAYAGKPDLNAYYIGGYWTHIGPSGWYVDAVLAGTRYEQKAKSSNDLRTEAKGWGVTASVEAGYPVPIGEKWHIEPQAQLVYQRLTVSNGEDDVSSVSYRTPDSVTARLGARLSGQYAYNTTQLRPFMEVSLLRDFAGTDTVTFSGIDRIDSRYQATAVDLTAGLVAQVRKDVGLWGQVGYGKSIGGGDGSDRGWAASLGLRIEY
ncbi:autotransporter outer membrane beta-barrel domain-containing protein [Bordetella parapertussis]|uniref:autotransporter outer membrane beta-barrel domain-containing protein n=1 Tax=Bordetella parapertussis TaxID=519 RepID=UPI00129863D4|nr:autotransporter outer membrane beta-barrel domain-containing protein [Bordetella parapertussis]QGB46528.1 autotransporter outer membrane beta-barrel domain-containing protein [Bordetella parapertussis]QGB50693.1 autotransporter outer membrane beta-barrel domain-containing protein [Bordetella parapertussis]QGB54878.1 autotransporter outer membrane beta-barrel domain-containing protein [Bordetella parapertussis]QGB83060.1 autotransporter outer membrane beta-barrel domain-containing protein [Bo